MFFPLLHRHSPAVSPPVRPRFAGLELHCRLLPMLGDGPYSYTESVGLLQTAYELGFSNILLTPPVMQGYYDLRPAQIRQATQKLCTEARIEQPGLSLRVGASYYTDNGLLTTLADGAELLSFRGDDLSMPATAPVEVNPPTRQRSGLGWSAQERPGPVYVLLETSLLTPSDNWDEIVRQIQARHQNPVLARAERYVFLQQVPERADQLHRAGIRFQLDISSLTGTNGVPAMRLARHLVANRLVSFIGFYPALDRFGGVLRQAVATNLFQELTASR
jgi:protein-tyrosine phosphatase